MKRLEVIGAVRPIYGSLGFKRLMLRHISALTVSHLQGLSYTCAVCFSLYVRNFTHY